MRGEKTIEFEFPIRYGANGNYSEATSITVREPGLGKAQVYQQMKMYVAQARPGIMRMAVELQAAVKAAGIGPDATDDAMPVDNGSDEERDVLDWMATGLGDKYMGFVEYVQKVLTNSPKLATIGEDKRPITDEVWETIADEGGMQAVNRILSGFTEFFFEDRSRPTRRSGADLSPTSPSPAPDSLSIKPRRISRSAN